MQGWHGSDNYLIFTNSYKMKMSVVFGVMQMTFGIILSLFNFVYFKKNVSIYNEFIPQMIFLQVRPSSPSSFCPFQSNSLTSFFLCETIKNRAFLATSRLPLSSSGALTGARCSPPVSSTCSFTCFWAPARFPTTNTSTKARWVPFCCFHRCCFFFLDLTSALLFSLS